MDQNDLRNLVGEELDELEVEALRPAHELIRTADPLDEVPSELAASIRAIPGSEEQPKKRERRRDVFKTRRAQVLALDAALAGIAFAIGWVARGGDEGLPSAADIVTLEATRFASNDAEMVIDVFPIDEAGNWVLLADIAGLEPAGETQHYELWLTQNGRVVASCGRFLVDADGQAQNLWFNAPYRFSEYDDWVVTLEGPGNKRSRVLLRAPVTTRAS